MVSPENSYTNPSLLVVGIFSMSTVKFLKKKQFSFIYGMQGITYGMTEQAIYGVAPCWYKIFGTWTSSPIILAYIHR